jgi:hypothetical protein
MLRIHDKVRNAIIVMCKAAGLSVRREPYGVLADNPDERPADLLIEGWTVPNIPFTTHAVDVTCPLADSGWAALSQANCNERASTVGIAGRLAEKKKTG